MNIFHRYLRSRWERYYLKNQWHLALDLSLIMIILILAAGLFYLYYYRPQLPGLGSLGRAPIDLDNPPLETSFSAVSVLHDGQPVEVSVSLKNRGSEAISDISLRLEAKTEGYSVSKISPDNTPGITAKDETINIDTIASGEEKSFLIKAGLKKLPAAGRQLDWQARLDYQLNDQPFSATVSLPKLTAAADLLATATAYYTSPQGDQLGIGPVPPVVGIPTDYWVFWEISSSGDFRDLSLSARLPKGVELTGERSLLSGDFNYNQDTRQLIWKVPALSPQDGISRLSFEVELTPADSQAGQEPVLTEAGRFFGTDVMTGEDISGNLPALTTALEKDRFNSGQGTVLPQ